MNFNVEIVEAYEIRDPNVKSQKKQGWSVHIFYIMYLEDGTAVCQDMRGLYAKYLPSGWFICMPTKKNIDEAAKCLVSFPILEFIDQEIKKEFISQIREKFIEHINEKLIKEVEEKEKRATVKEKREKVKNLNEKNNSKKQINIKKK